MGTENIDIDPEFKALCPPLSAEERAQLVANILEAGKVRDPLVLWSFTLLDGHNRLEIAREHGLPYTTVQVKGVFNREDAIAWIIRNQFGRRNLTAEQVAYLRGKRYASEKRQGERTDRTSVQSGQKLETAERLSVEYKVSSATIQRDAQYAEAVDTLAEVCGQEARDGILRRDVEVAKKDVIKLAGLAAGDPAWVKQLVGELQAGNEVDFDNVFSANLNGMAHSSEPDSATLADEESDACVVSSQAESPPTPEPDPERQIEPANERQTAKPAVTPDPVLDARQKAEPTANGHHSGEPVSNGEAQADDSLDKRAASDPGSEPIKDAKGRPVPVNLLEVFEARTWFRSKINHLGRLLTEMEAYKEEHKASAFHLHILRMAPSVRQLQENIRFATPYVVCPECSGAGCPGDPKKVMCSGVGWITEGRFEHLTIKQQGECIRHRKGDAFEEQDQEAQQGERTDRTSPQSEEKLETADWLAG